MFYSVLGTDENSGKEKSKQEKAWALSVLEPEKKALWWDLHPAVPIKIPAHWAEKKMLCPTLYGKKNIESEPKFKIFLFNCR
jgi:hypothetical protein